VTPCPICATNDPAPGLVVCHGCLARIDHDLERIAELTRLAALPLSTAATGGDLGQPDPHRAVTDLDRLDAACGHGILELLDDWQRAVRAHFGLAPLGVATETTLSAQIRRMNAGGPGDAATSRGLDTATEER
jgi:hypothetical protein